ncbi:hypothetical protein Taro_035771 [Colocasia esculenta]|uniref:Uncharacterized protein n=1 Tax=Colocasia esculenta TaxID=4460 RepID=A0A843W6M0_COLES|nr:hypothetical protein [Colocasia esculenta]
MTSVAEQIRLLPFFFRSRYSFHVSRFLSSLATPPELHRRRQDAAVVTPPELHCRYRDAAAGTLPELHLIAAEHEFSKYTSTRFEA